MNSRDMWYASRSRNRREDYDQQYEEEEWRRDDPRMYRDRRPPYQRRRSRFEDINFKKPRPLGERRSVRKEYSRSRDVQSRSFTEKKKESRDSDEEEKVAKEKKDEKVNHHRLEEVQRRIKMFPNHPIQKMMIKLLRKKII